jgi:hypothetical protein
MLMYCQNWFVEELWCQTWLWTWFLKFKDFRYLLDRLDDDQELLNIKNWIRRFVDLVPRILAQVAFFLFSDDPETIIPSSIEGCDKSVDMTGGDEQVW